MNIICFSDITWNFLWQRQQQLISRFPDDWKILYVEPSWWLSFVWGIINKQITNMIPHKIKHNITIISVPTISVLDKFPKLRKINDWIITWWIRVYLKKYNMTEPIFMFYKPRYSCVVDKLNSKLIYYDVTDDVLEFTNTPKWLTDYYKKLTEKSELITVSSKRLYDKISKFKKDGVFLVGNGVDYDHYVKSIEQNVNVPNELEGIKSIKIGYIGAVGEWFDFILLEKILSRHSNMTVIIIGWVFRKYHKEINELRSKYPNLVVLGRKKFEDLPSYVNSFDIGIIPFKINELTLSVNPNKLYEYMALGKPVVSISLPEIEKYCENIRLAKNHDEFLDHISSILSQKINREKLQDLAKANSWDYKAKEVIELIKKNTKP